MAMLPLVDAPDGSARSALVWVQEPELAGQAHALPDGASSCAELQQRFGYRLGRLLRVGERHLYPLSLTRATEQARAGIVLLGNAAHALHPVAGQGFNLSLRDVAALAETLERPARVARRRARSGCWSASWRASVPTRSAPSASATRCRASSAAACCRWRRRAISA